MESKQNWLYALKACLGNSYYAYDFADMLYNISRNRIIQNNKQLEDKGLFYNPLYDDCDELSKIHFFLENRTLLQNQSIAAIYCLGTYVNDAYRPSISNVISDSDIITNMEAAWRLVTSKDEIFAFDDKYWQQENKNNQCHKGFRDGILLLELYREQLRDNGSYNLDLRDYRYHESVLKKLHMDPIQCGNNEIGWNYYNAYILKTCLQNTYLVNDFATMFRHLAQIPENQHLVFLRNGSDRFYYNKIQLVKYKFACVDRFFLALSEEQGRAVSVISNLGSNPDMKCFFTSHDYKTLFIKLYEQWEKTTLWNYMPLEQQSKQLYKWQRVFKREDFIKGIEMIEEFRFNLTSSWSYVKPVLSLNQYPDHMRTLLCNSREFHEEEFEESNVELDG